MRSTFKPLPSLVLAGLLASVAIAASAQPAFTPAPSTSTSSVQPQATDGHRGHFDPAKMQAHRAKRQAHLKDKLKITAAQESAWATYAAALQPPPRADRSVSDARAEFEKLSTPERIDKMRALRNQRMTEINAYIDKRDQATKTFYATLAPEQQKTFDAVSSYQGHGRNHGWHRRFG